MRSTQRTLLFSAGIVVVLLLLGTTAANVAGRGPKKPATTTTTTAASAPVDCGLQMSPKFFARETEGNQFGPAAPEEAQAAHADFQARRLADAALLVATQESIAGFTTPQDRLQKTVDAFADPATWCAHEAAIQAKLASAVKVEVVEKSGPYKTLDMVDKDRLIPEIFQVNVEARPFKVLRYTFADGSVLEFKLNCGYQVVLQEFPPQVPGAPPAPPAQPVQPSKPAGHKPTTPVSPPTTTVTTTTWKCTAERMADGVCGSGGNNHPSHVDTEPLPPTPDYVPGNAEDSAADPADGVIIPPGGNMSPGNTNGTTGGNTGFNDPAPTEATPQPVNEPGDPGAPA